MKLTDNEVKALNAIVKSEYQDGNPVDHAVWTSYCNPFKPKSVFPGVIASLVKKGCVVTGGSTADANREAGCDGTTLAITQTGYDALQAALKAPTPQQADDALMIEALLTYAQERVNYAATMENTLFMYKDKEQARGVIRATLRQSERAKELVRDLQAKTKAKRVVRS